MEERIVFISGKVTGLPRWWVVLKFKWYEILLLLVGYEVYNPVVILSKTISWQEAMEECLDALPRCGYIFFMPGWIKSRGARREFRHAVYNRLICINGNSELQVRYANLIVRYAKQYHNN